MKSYFIVNIVLISLSALVSCAVLKSPHTQASNDETIQASDPSTQNAVSGFVLTEDPAAQAIGAEADEASSDTGDDAAVALGEKEQAEENLLDTALEIVDTAQEHWAAGDREKTIEALDQAYALILNVPINGNAKLNQQKEDLRFMISKRIMEIYATRFTTANGKHNEIPLVVNEYVEREIKLFQTAERDFFLESYQRSGKYRAEFVKAFREAGLPEDLAWLPLIESGFKARALSRARALGLWQFIPSTGYKFGLKRNAWIDERLDPAKATAAAIAYMKELHEIFGDWATVLAAYNCGEGNVLRVIRSQKVNYLDNFWDLYERLPRETARYYPRFLAVLSIIKDPAKYGFVLDGPESAVPYDVVTLEKPLHLKKLAEKSGCSLEMLCELNPELRQEATPNTLYELKVPVGAKESVLASLDSIPKWSPPKPSFVVHRVRRGETLSTIALRYRTSIQRILEANRLGSGRLIRIGQKLRIPLRETS